MFQSIKNHACAWLCGVFYLIPALHGIGVVSKRELMLYHEVATYAVIAGLSVVLAIVAFRNHKHMGRSERIFAVLAPAAAMLHAFLMISGMKEWTSAFCGLCGCIAALAVFVRCSGGAPIRGGLGLLYGAVALLGVGSFGGWVGTAMMLGIGCIALVLMKEGRLKAFIGAVYGVLGTVAGVFLLLGILFTTVGFGAEYTSEVLDAPNGKSTAKLVFVDEGALGSHQYMLVEEKSAGINVLIGRLKKSERISLDNQRYVYDWDKEVFVPFAWVDEHTLMVDGYSIHVDG